MTTCLFINSISYTIRLSSRILYLLIPCTIFSCPYSYLLFFLYGVIQHSLHLTPGGFHLHYFSVYFIITAGYFCDFHLPILSHSDSCYYPFLLFYDSVSCLALVRMILSLVNLCIQLIYELDSPLQQSVLHIQSSRFLPDTHCDVGQRLPPAASIRLTLLPPRKSQTMRGYLS